MFDSCLCKMNLQVNNRPIKGNSIMKVFNMFEQEVKEVAVQFEYKGFTVSASNIMGKSFMEIVCWSNENPSIFHSGFATVESVITFINNEVNNYENAN